MRRSSETSLLTLENLMHRLSFLFALLLAVPAVAFAQKNSSQDDEAKQKIERIRAKVMEAMKNNVGLKVGEKAPTFKLKSLDGATETDLADLLKSKPVVLIFGSYT